MAKKTTTQPALGEYKRKRNFKKTPEPKAKPVKLGKPRKLRFCVQKHLASHLHYDFRLEHNGVLLSWAVPKGPSLNPRDKRLAMQVEDHPLEYRKFEGVIPEGYGAGIVMLWDEGTWQPEVDDIDAALEKGDLKFALEGVKLKGSWVLVRTGGRGRANSDARQWLLIKHRDEWAGDVNVIDVAPLSVTTSRDLPEILAQAKPKIWKTYKPQEGGGETGELRDQVVKRAVELRAKKLARA